MENLNFFKIKKKIKKLSKNLNDNYFELLDIYKKLIIHYYLLRINQDQNQQQNNFNLTF